ncbi:hypothetical protein [Pedosphaera parvula]|uniref:Uncharacterized protein n=1 Tax=Pedosphaera parvula (strain Ellin514) TaxID=320771 RepID=B9XNM8_PEDPL|nr:hypothetical protein [Pedosphaera parvula]EEF58568.1 hypothetical protein Cflav_PD1758 [Pedosphaera parvula Ellin514]
MQTPKKSIKKHVWITQSEEKARLGFCAGTHSWIVLLLFTYRGERAMPEQMVVSSGKVSICSRLLRKASSYEIKPPPFARVVRH